MHEIRDVFRTCYIHTSLKHRTNQPCKIITIWSKKYHKNHTHTHYVVFCCWRHMYMYIKTISYKQLACMCIDPSRDIAVHFAMKWVTQWNEKHVPSSNPHQSLYIYPLNKHAFQSNTAQHGLSADDWPLPCLIMKWQWLVWIWHMYW